MYNLKSLANRIQVLHGNEYFSHHFYKKLIENYIKEKKDSGKKLLFLEKVGDRNTSREKIKENLIKVLEANGFKIKNKK